MVCTVCDLFVYSVYVPGHIPCASGDNDAQVTCFLPMRVGCHRLGHYHSVGGEIMFRAWQVRWYLLSALTLLVLLANIWLSVTLGITLAVLSQSFALLLSVGIVFLLYRDMRRDEEQRQVFLKITQELTSKLELGDLFDYIVQATLVLVPTADKCVIHLLDESGRRLYPRYTSESDLERTLGMPMGKGIAGRALKELRTEVIPDVRREPEFLHLQSSPDLCSLMVAPLHVEGNLLGTLSLNSKTRDAFSENDKRVVTMLAAQASAALYQTRLYASARRETHYMEAILNNLSDGLIVLDAESCVLRCNPSLACILGPDLSRLVGRKVDPDSDSEAIRRLAFLLGDNQDIHQSYERRVELDEPVHAILRVSVSPVLDQEGNWAQIAVIRDQTQEEDRIRTGENLLAAASRELEAPLEAIRGYAMLVRSIKGPEEPGAVQWVHQIREKSTRLIRLAQDLADLQAIQRGTLAMNTEPVSIVDMLSEIVDEMTPSAERNNVSINVQCPPNLPDPVLDRERIRHVLLNLLENALHRAVQGGHINVRVEASLEELTFTLTDDGAPVPPEDRARIFEGLYRANGARPEGPAGTGLGLYISQKIVEAHGGYLWMSENAEHNKFQFILPQG